MGKSRPITFVENDKGCIMPISHKLNPDGYFRKRWGSFRKGGSIIEFFHRFIFRAHKGEIPDGWEVDHTCNNRACCNPDHLRIMEGSEHTIHTNRTRWLQ